MVIIFKINSLSYVEFKVDTCLKNKKLIFFSGQIVIYENLEKSPNLVNNLYKDLFFNYLVIKQKLNNKGEVYDTLSNIEESDFKSNDGHKEVYNDESLVYLERVDDNLHGNKINDINKDYFNENEQNSMRFTKMMFTFLNKILINLQIKNAFFIYI